MPKKTTTTTRKTVKEDVKLVSNINKRSKPKKKEIVRPKGINVLNVKRQLEKHFVNSMLYPDVTGPKRIPRAGSSDRTNLGMDHTYGVASYVNTGSIVVAVQLGTVYNSAAGAGSIFYANSVTTQFGSNTGTVNLGVQFPSASSVEDISLTSGCILITFIGDLTKTQGDIIYGCGPAIGYNTTYNNLLYYPGTTRVPVSKLAIDGCMRIPLKHISPRSWEFVATGSAVQDVETPFFAITGTAINDGKFGFEIIRNWEARPTITSSSGIPYDVATESFSTDSNAFQDACATLSNMGSGISEGFNNMVSSLWREHGPTLTRSAVNMAAHGLTNLSRFNWRSSPQYHLQNIGYRPMLEVGGKQSDPLATAAAEDVVREHEGTQLHQLRRLIADNYDGSPNIMRRG